MTDLTILFTNADGQTVLPTMLSDPTFDDFLDKPRRATLKVAKGHAVDPQGTIKISRKGSIKLIGHITKLDQSKPDYDTIICDSAEALLSARIGQFYRFAAGTTLTAMLTFLLSMANGLIPRGAWSLHSGNVYKIVGAGTTSVRFGTLASLYQNSTLLTKVAVIPTAAGQWYQDATTLYIRTTTGATPDNFLIIAPLFKDTLVRIGTIDSGTSTFAVVFELGAAPLWPTMQALITAANLEWEMRPEKDGYVYLDAKAAVGRGSATEPVITYVNGKNAEVSTTPIDGAGRLQALLGQGAGAGITQQCAAAIDFSTRGTFREGTVSQPSLFGAMLKTATDKTFLDYQDGTVYNVRAPVCDWALGRGDYVGVAQEGHQPVVRRVKHITYKAGGDMAIEAGQRLRTIQELLKGDQEIQRILNSFYGSHTKNAWSWSFQAINIDSYTARTVDFTLKNSEDNGEIDSNFPYTVLLNLKVGWYTSTVNKATVSGPSHGSVGSHAGYGGINTGNAGQKILGAGSVTASATGTLARVMLINYPAINTGSGGAHSHSVTVNGAWYYTVPSGYSAWGPTGTGSAASAGAHAHSTSTSLSSAYIPTQAHQHALPSSPLTTSDDHPHNETLKSSKTRAGSAAHPDQDLTDDNQKLEYLLSELGTGHSVHYLTLTVKVNGSSVTGSPFTDLYIGDALDDIDISGLVTVGGKNVITLQISEYGGTGPVRCSLSGGVNVNAIISAF